MWSSSVTRTNRFAKPAGASCSLIPATRANNVSRSNAAWRFCMATGNGFAPNFSSCDAASPLALRRVRPFTFLDMSAPSDAHLPGDDALQALREALRASPNNSALRLHFADTLLGRGHAEEAEREYREGLAQSPNSLAMKLG